MATTTLLHGFEGRAASTPSSLAISETGIFANRSITDLEN